MKCGYCQKDFAEGTGASMYAAGELIANYCSSYCMGKSFQRMTLLLENVTRKKPKNKKKGGKNAKKITSRDNSLGKKATRP